MPSALPPTSEREQTDESLRTEREKADLALGEKLAALDETADAVISRARARADQVLQRSRAKIDTTLANHGGPQAESVVKRERHQEDQALVRERQTADDTLREQRAEQLAVLATERQETDKDLLSERARADDALASRDEFLAIVTHDLRNILSGMVGFAALIAEKAGGEQGQSEIAKYAQRIQRSGGRMDRLIGDLVDVASIHAGVLTVNQEPGDPAGVVKEAVETFQPQATSREISLTAEIEADSPSVMFDPPRILQVLTNLLSNALKFTPAGGTVKVRVQTVAEGLRFAVTDTGLGIPADQLERVFERYIQVTPDDRRGLGLGLYISKCIVQGHGGRIWAESQEGQGSSFYVTLPTGAAALPAT
jgi:signal transduction histidine kinase